MRRTAQRRVKRQIRSSGNAIASAPTFRSIREHRNYRLWFGGQSLSVTGNWLQSVAQAWFIADLTHSPIALGLLSVCQFGPYMLLGLFGGAITDRLDNRHTLMGTQAAQMCSAIAIAILALTGVAQPWQVYVLAAFNGTVLVLDTPARQAFTIEMVNRDELPNAVALNSSLFNAGRVLGPAIGGVLIASLGVGVCFAVNAVSFLAVLGALWAMNPTELTPPRRRSGHASLLRDTREGFVYTWRTPSIRAITGMMLVIATVSLNFNVLLPVLAQNTLASGPATFGWLSASFGAGALIGALTSATIGRPSRATLLTAAAGLGLSQLILAPLHSIWLCGLLLVVAGIAFSLYTSMSNSSIQMVVPDRLRGRVMGIYSYGFLGPGAAGGLFAGWLAAQGGTQLAFGVAGIATLGVAGAGTAGLHLRKRRLGRKTPPTVAGPEVSMPRE